MRAKIALMTIAGFFLTVSAHAQSTPDDQGDASGLLIVFVAVAVLLVGLALYFRAVNKRARTNMQKRIERQNAPEGRGTEPHYEEPRPTSSTPSSSFVFVESNHHHHVPPPTVVVEPAASCSTDPVTSQPASCASAPVSSCASAPSSCASAPSSCASAPSSCGSSSGA
ncbi:MAG TPA: hypothetical protein V6C81_21485 [Planktothrix sp.]